MIIDGDYSLFLKNYWTNVVMKFDAIPERIAETI